MNGNRYSIPACAKRCLALCFDAVNLWLHAATVRRTTVAKDRLSKAGPYSTFFGQPFVYPRSLTPRTLKRFQDDETQLLESL